MKVQEKRFPSGITVLFVPVTATRSTPLWGMLWTTDFWAADPGPTAGSIRQLGLASKAAGSKEISVESEAMESAPVAPSVAGISKLPPGVVDAEPKEISYAPAGATQAVNEEASNRPSRAARCDR